MQQVKAGLKAIYLSGWQVAGDANSNGEMYPDQSLYAVDSVPKVVKRINNAFTRADQIQWSEGKNDTDYFAPIVADAEAGFGGPLNCFEMMKAMIEAGAAGVHFEDQLSSEKKCGHLGGKVLVPTSQFVRSLVAARLAADVLDVTMEDLVEELIGDIQDEYDVERPAEEQASFGITVVDGLLKMSADNAQGQTMTFTGVPPGGWFGEGTALKREPYRYNIQALRNSVVAGLPLETFHWLLDHSIGFNRFVMNQINERLGQFIAAREIDRMTNPDLRVARSLAALFNPVLYPGVGEILRITQQELAYLVGLSRQRVNEALSSLHAQGIIRVEYGGLRVLDLAALRANVFASTARGPG
jgi:CRP-like cAMP-binding protein